MTLTIVNHNKISDFIQNVLSSYNEGSFSVLVERDGGYYDASINSEMRLRGGPLEDEDREEIEDFFKSSRAFYMFTMKEKHLLHITSQFDKMILWT